MNVCVCVWCFGRVGPNHGVRVALGESARRLATGLTRRRGGERLAGWDAGAATDSSQRRRARRCSASEFHSRERRRVYTVWRARKKNINSKTNETLSLSELKKEIY